MNNKTKLLIFKFISSSVVISSTLLISGCISEDIDTKTNIETEYQEEIVKLDKNNLIDDRGMKYSLKENLDGTESAIFEDGQEIIFKRNESTGDLELIAPKDNSDLESAGLGFLAGIVTSYFLSKGLNPPSGYVEGNKFVANSRPFVISSVDRDNYYNRYLKDKERKQRYGGGDCSF